MPRQVALCLDEQSYQNPALVGLGDEVLEAQDWLAVYCTAAQARRNIRQEGSIGAVWVVSCNDIDPINLAAALKGDRPELHVCLVTAERCGSLCSRAHAAMIDEVVECAAFVRAYSQAKRRALSDAASEVDFGAAGVVGSSPKGAMEQMAAHGRSTQPDDSRSAIAFGSSPSKSGRIPTHMRVPGPPQEPALCQSPLSVPRAPGADALAATVPLAPVSHKGFLMSVVSGSGGAGKSSVAVVAAMSAARRGFRTLLLDYDLQFGDMAMMAAVENALDIDEALDQPERLQRLLTGLSPLSVLASPSRLEAAEAVVRELPALLDALAPHFDVIVANTGAAWAEQHAALLERSSIALFLIDQRSSSLWACRHALELCSRCGIATVPFRFALNRCAKSAPFAAMDVVGILQGAQVFELREGGAEVEECLSGGAIDELLASNNEFVRSVEAMLDSLLPQSESTMEGAEVPTDNGRRRFRRGRHGAKRRGR